MAGLFAAWLLSAMSAATTKSGKAARERKEPIIIKSANFQICGVAKKDTTKKKAKVEVNGRIHCHGQGHESIVLYYRRGASK